MSNSCCPPPVDYDPIFGRRVAADELDAYRRDGARGSTRRLIDSLVANGVAGASVIDVGAGVGVVGFELLAAGAERFTDVDASHAYLAAVRREAKRRGVDDQVVAIFGDFAGLAAELDDADIVTLDRVVCCYPDWQSLVDAAARRSRRLVGLVYPVDRWWIRAGMGVLNLWLRVSGQSFRAHAHPTRAIDARIRSAGFEPVVRQRGFVWQTFVYRRAAAA